MNTDTRRAIFCIIMSGKDYVDAFKKLVRLDSPAKQLCLWDQFKELESMLLIRSMHLAKLVAEMIASFSLSLAVLKIIDFSDPKLLTPKRIMHFRMLFEAIFEYPDNLIWNMFTRIASP